MSINGILEAAEYSLGCTDDTNLTQHITGKALLEAEEESSFASTEDGGQIGNAVERSSGCSVAFTTKCILVECQRTSNFGEAIASLAMSIIGIWHASILTMSAAAVIDAVDFDHETETIFLIRI